MRGWHRLDDAIIIQLAIRAFDSTNPGRTMRLTAYEDIERCFAGGWSDGLPVVPPYGTLVDQMLGEMGWKPSDIIGEMKEQNIEVRAEHVAAAAVMAGCEFRYGRLLRALSENLLDPRFNLSGVEVTTGGAGVLVIVSGPVVEELGFEHGSNALGANRRANATVGRFAQMVRYFCGRGGGVMHSHGTMGHPGRITYCIAEHPQTLWPKFHTQSNLPENVSAVSIMSAEGPNSVNNHYGNAPEPILDTIADCLGHAGTTNYYWHFGAYLVVLGPGHAETIIKGGFTREQARHYLFEKAKRSTDELKRLGRMPADPRAKSKVVYGTMRSPFDSESQIYFIECGADGGRFSAVIPGWVGCYSVISRQID
jgi:hypothetical protein